VTPDEARGLPDVQEFLEILNTLDHSPTPEARNLFLPGRERVVTRAPGRLDLMGGIADYSGSLVLELPLREATLVALQRDPERALRVVSLGDEASRRAVDFSLPLAELERHGQPVDYAAARQLFRRDPSRSWAAYVAGAFLVLMRERGFRFPEGARILISSRVPEGKGVSSSAALEVAVMQAVAAAFDLPVPPEDLAPLCQVVENQAAGAPCGVMDQMTAACGSAGELLALLCQPAHVLPDVQIPSHLAVWGLDSGIRHSVGGSDYTAVRVGAFMGYRIIADLAGLSVHPGPAGRVQVDDPIWNGYLARITPSLFRQRFAEHLPERMRGADFLARYGGHMDPVTEIDPDREYAIRTPTAHPIEENFRVRTFALVLSEGTAPDLTGELMYQSHASYSACGLGSPGTDRLVEMVRQVGRERGMDGAKITGGGSGGTVAVLGSAGAGHLIEEIAARYAEETGHRPQVFTGSSPGAALFGHLRLAGR
jgi:L-arabinokinase